MTNEQTTDQATAKSLGEILSRYFNFWGEPAQKAPKRDNRKPRKPETSTHLKLLKPIPWLLCLLFIFSFYWDFQQVEASIGTIELNFEGLLRIISISGLIGFLTNRIAITMLFRPMKKRPLLGHGLIPAHKEKIARRLAISVSDDLINSELIQKKLEQSGAISRYRNKMALSVNRVIDNPEFRADIKHWLSSTLTEMIADPEFRNRLASGIADEVERSTSANVLDKAALKAYMFLKGRHIRELVGHALMQFPEKIGRELTFVDDYLDKLPGLIEESSHSIDEFASMMLEKLIRQLDVEKIVEENLRNYDESNLERMIKSATNEQLNTIQYLGAVLGTIGGFVIWEPVLSLVLIGSLFGLLYLADWLLT